MDKNVRNKIDNDVLYFKYIEFDYDLNIIIANLFNLNLIRTLNSFRG